MKNLHEVFENRINHTQYLAFQRYSIYLKRQYSFHSQLYLKFSLNRKEPYEDWIWPAHNLNLAIEFQLNNLDESVYLGAK